MKNERLKEIVNIFTTWVKRQNNKNEIKTIKLEELKQADQMIGPKDENSPYRIAIRYRIVEIENRRNRLWTIAILVVAILALVVGILTLAATYIK